MLANEKLPEKWIWDKKIIKDTDNTKYIIKFQTISLFDRWNINPNDIELIYMMMYTNRSKKKCFVWYFESEDKKHEFIKTFKESIDKIKPLKKDLPIVNTTDSTTESINM